MKNKYILNISSSSGEKLGYVAFFLQPERGELVFSGIYVGNEHRSKGLSKLFLLELERIASSIDYQFTRTKPQRKPVTCALLARSGFEPSNGLPTSRRIFVGRTDIGLVGVHFECPAMKSHFEGSSLYKVEPYITCGFHELTNPIQIATHRSYFRRLSCGSLR